MLIFWYWHVKKINETTFFFIQYWKKDRWGAFETDEGGPFYSALAAKDFNISITMDKIFQYCTCPAGQMTYNFHSSCKHTHMSFKSVFNKEQKGVIWLPWVILPKALILPDECFGKNYSSFLDFNRNYERRSGIFVPCNIAFALQD